ncbi:hypothetical protein [Vreelandella maris]|uniref:Uncharacterized protein n=1 Tax=Vreelandella maris TaxID=2729617 RepID=A0A7Y6RG48_9GAMM|nr:hypothetical protein [Halomonas maris]NVF16221.1 hypothetical protein [Halomonas maris]|tara:strand:+ start:11530 stop:12351 length:822 start_codon:yes stop_codon:yes gene_type:complete
MSGNLRLIIDNLHDAATLTATSEALPITYTQRSGRAYPWRSVDTSEQVIEGSFETLTFLDTVVLYRHNLSASATVRLERLRNTDVVSDTGEVSAAELIAPPLLRLGVDPWGASYNDKIPVQVKPFWLEPDFATGYRITIKDSANPDGCIQIGCIIVGFSFSPTFNASYGVKLTEVEMVEHRRTEGGSLRSVGSDGIYRRLNIDLKHMDDADRTTLTTELVKRGRRANIFVSLYPKQGGVKEVEHSFLAKREGDYEHIHDFYNNWQTSLSFLEV